MENQKRKSDADDDTDNDATGQSNHSFSISIVGPHHNETYQRFKEDSLDLPVNGWAEMPEGQLQVDAVYGYIIALGVVLYSPGQDIKINERGLECECYSGTDIQIDERV
ncbi:hypothetical protein MAR_000931 [Mya arenaria]|uniref:Uncharacterized protein n=1 Tax=Mya arenaria TaxID=6604 RepID=A0ABY7FAA1_MYAAR|nr:hypothetical protein MAR_000931 [Mya arenaria]